MGFSTALTGIKAAGKDLTVTSNNIANANTTGFKKSRAEFTDIYASSLNSSAGSQVGAGAKVNTIAQNFAQGSVEFTDNAMDMAVSGQGFFSLAQTTDAERPIMYTRNGEFKVNDVGYVVTNDGDYLMGFKANGLTVEEGFTEGAFSTIQLAATVGGPLATTTVATSVNVDSRSIMPSGFDTTPATNGSIGGVDPLDPKTYNHVSSVTVFDSLGNAHVASTYFVSERELPTSVNATALAAVKTNIADAGNLATMGVAAVNTAVVTAAALPGATLETIAAAAEAAGAGAGAAFTAAAKLVAAAVPTSTAAATAAVVRNYAAPGTLATVLAVAEAATPSLNVAGNAAAADAAAVTAASVTGATEASIIAAAVAAVVVVTAGSPTAAEIADQNAISTALTAAIKVVSVDGGNKFNTVTDVYSASTAQNWQAHFFVDGQHIKPNGTLGTSTTVATTPTSKSGIATTDYTSLTFDTNGKLATVGGSTTSTIISYTTIPVGGSTGIDASINVEPLTINFDLANTTRLSSEYAVKDLNQNGIPVGNLTGIDIDEKGVVLARFSNGGFDILGKVVLSRFSNNQGLENVGGSLWKESLESGQAVAGQAGTGSFGLINSGALEGSNVDLSQQLVHLIIAQQSYQANAQSISTEKTIMQTILQA